jgi:tRNA A37 threonylcarbamoyladenosine modification protein TsaB
LVLGCCIEAMVGTGHPLLEGCPVLVLDAASPRLFVGVLAATERDLVWQKNITTEAGAIEQLFPALQSVLLDCGLSLPTLRGIVVCEGPGNLLGLRTAVLATETWRASGMNAHCQIWSYSSLDLMQHVISTDYPGGDDLDLLMDWRRGHWFRCRRRAGDWLAADTVALDTLDAADISTKVYHIRGRGNWPGPPLAAEALDYQPLRLASWLTSGGQGVVRSQQQCQVRGEPVKTYVRWSGNRHGS